MTPAIIFREKKTPVTARCTARAAYVRCAVNLPYVRLCGAASLVRDTSESVMVDAEVQYLLLFIMNR